mmetsp:Transcript_18343/g.51462  ORF Transcript_18343/g.51462 Transcript_18343/m.51462 type:complete len:86 (-) Transcript_18343:86-343(-)
MIHMHGYCMDGISVCLRDRRIGALGSKDPYMATISLLKNVPLTISNHTIKHIITSSSMISISREVDFQCQWRQQWAWQRLRREHL